MAYISCKDLSLGYEDGVVAEHISFEVNKGEYLCVVGENGAGKSTLIKTMLHLMKPLAGELVMGDGITSREIGYLPQQTLVQKDFPSIRFAATVQMLLTRITVTTIPQENLATA